jgi:hypothetical protein
MRTIDFHGLVELTGAVPVGSSAWLGGRVITSMKSIDEKDCQNNWGAHDSDDSEYWEWNIESKMTKSNTSVCVKPPRAGLSLQHSVPSTRPLNHPIMLDVDFHIM